MVTSVIATVTSNAIVYTIEDQDSSSPITNVSNIRRYVIKKATVQTNHRGGFPMYFNSMRAAFDAFVALIHADERISRVT